MRITHVFRSFPNKNQPYNKVLLNRLIHKGVNCSVASFTSNDTKSELNITGLGHSLMSWPFYLLRVVTNYKLFRDYQNKSERGIKTDISYFGRFAKLLNPRPDVIHIHHIQLLNRDFLNFLKITNINCVVSLRGGDVLVRPFRNNGEMKFLLEVVDAIKNIHLVSNHLKSSLQKLTSSKLNFYVIKRSSETEKGVKMENKSPIPTIVSIGRLHWTKGYVYALKALSMLKLDGFNFKYHICGEGSIEQKDQLIFLINHYGLFKDVILEGHQSQDGLDTLLSKASIYLQPSVSEGIPNTILRALFLRIPIVTTDAGGIPEVFNNVKDGLMVEKANSRELFEALKKLLLNSKLQDEIRESKPLKLSNSDKEIENYLSMYDNILPSKQV